MSAALIMKLLELILLGITVVPAVRAEMEALRARLAPMVADGRDPTPEEWAAINADIAEKIARLKQSGT